MKVINRKQSPVTEQELIQACKEEDRRAQKILYDRYAPVMFGVCKRYLKTREDAEDVLVGAFFKVLTHLHQYKGEDSYKGRFRRKVVNEALMFLRRRHNFNMTVEISNVDAPAPAKAIGRIAEQEILSLLNQLPTGYRTVFNLYALEGYKHREIADMLGISINTSKSQLILARKRMQELVGQAGDSGIGVSG